MALAAIALLAGLTAAFAAADVSALAGRQRSELTAAVAVAAAAAWDRNNSWTGADLSPVLDLASRTGADVKILDRAGRVVAVSPGFAAHASDPQFSAPAEVRGAPVGQAVVRFTGPAWARPTTPCSWPCSGPSPAPRDWPRWPRCSLGWPWPGGSPARSPGSSR